MPRSSSKKCARASHCQLAQRLDELGLAAAAFSPAITLQRRHIRMRLDVFRIAPQRLLEVEARLLQVAEGKIGASEIQEVEVACLRIELAQGRPDAALALARQAGDMARSRAYWAKLVELAGKGDAPSELQQAKTSLARN